MYICLKYKLYTNRVPEHGIELKGKNAKFKFIVTNAVHDQPPKTNNMITKAHVKTHNHKAKL